MKKVNDSELAQVVGGNGNKCLKGIAVSAGWGARHGWVGALIGAVGGFGKHCVNDSRFGIKHIGSITLGVGVSSADNFPKMMLGDNIHREMVLQNFNVRVLKHFLGECTLNL